MSGEGLTHVEADLTAEELQFVRWLHGQGSSAARKLLASIPKPPRRLTYDDLLDMTPRQIVGLRVVAASGGVCLGVVVRIDWEPNGFMLRFSPGGSLTLYPGDWIDVEDPS